MKTYTYKVLTGDRFLVQVDEYIKKYDLYKFKESREHHIDFKKDDWLCDCKGFHYNKMCSHIKFVLSQLRDGGGILDYNHNEGWEDLHLVKDRHRRFEDVR